MKIHQINIRNQQSINAAKEEEEEEERERVNNIHINNNKCFKKKIFNATKFHQKR